MRPWVPVIAVLATACGRSDDGLRAIGELGAVYGVPNIDDDDGDGVRDFRDDRVEGENDLATLDLTPVIDEMRGRDSLQLVLTGDDVADIRVWAGDRLILAEDYETVIFERDTVPDAIQVEFKDFLDRARLTLIHRKPSRAMLGLARRSDERSIFEQVSVDLVSSPLILSHHLQPAELAYVGEGGESPFPGYSLDNFDMVDALADSLGDRLVVDALADFGFDPWVQDEFETATLTSPSSRIDVVIDSIRDRGLDDFPEDVVADRPDSVVRTWGDGMQPTSQDSFGNLEVSPPVTVDGVFYPFGRIYWGEWQGEGLVRQLGDFLRSQRVQAPFTLDVSWLLVGHVDEFTTWLPDASAPKGFRLYVADTDVAYAFLDGLPASTPIDPRYGDDHGYATLEELRDDKILRELNRDYQIDYIEPAIAQLERQLGLDDADIVRVPGIFEEVGGPWTAALIPGAVNMLVATNDDGTATAFLPDPYFRGAGQPQSADPFIAAFEALLPADVEPVWVDDWDVYHMGLGEVHCGTNTTRTPTAAWWEDAMHLIDGGDQ